LRGRLVSGSRLLCSNRLVDTDHILGAHIPGSEAGEVINLFALAIRFRMHTIDLKHMLFAYPTSGSNMERML